MVPPWACSNRPLCSRCAPVKAPLSWPNSRSSIRLSGMAAQLSATNGARARADASCSTRASTSLPEPVGPTSRAVTSACATRWASASRCWLAGSTNTTLRTAAGAAGAAGSGRVAPALASRCSWASTMCTRCQLGRRQSCTASTPSAPRWVASTASSSASRSTRANSGNATAASASACCAPLRRSQFHESRITPARARVACPARSSSVCTTRTCQPA